jgi:pyrophosphatase PpaX
VVTVKPTGFGFLTVLSFVGEDLNDALQVTGPRGMPSSIGAVVFDFDDTLAETLPARVEAMRRTFLAAGIGSPDAESFVHSQRGIPLRVSLDGFDGGRGKELGLLGAYRKAYWHKEPGLLRLFDGVSELVRALREHGTRSGILTSKARDIVVDGRASGTVVELAELGLGHLAEHTIGFEDVSQPKPHPEGLERLLGWLGATPGETLVVGDSAADILTAQNAGCWSCLAGWGVPTDERAFGEVTPDVVAEHPSAVQRLVTGAIL